MTSRAGAQRGGRAGAPQVEVAVLQAHLVRHGQLVVELERQRRGGRQHLHRGGGDLDVAGGQRGVAVALRARPDLAGAPARSTPPAASCADASPRSSRTTTWTMPEPSRRSRKATPPWSRRRATQPARVTVVPACSSRSVPAEWVRITGGAPRGGGQVVERDGGLLAGPQVLDGGGAGLEVTVAEHHRVRRAAAVRGLHRALQAAVAVREVGGDPAARAARRPARRARRLGGRPSGTRNTPSPAAAGASTPSAVSARMVRSTPERPADAGQRRPADLLGQPVVAPAPADRRLRARARRAGTRRWCACSSPDRGPAAARPRRRRRGRPGGRATASWWSRQAAHSASTITGASASCACTSGALVVEHPQRVERSPRAGVLVEVEPGQEAGQPRRGTPAGTPRRRAR